MALPVIPLTYRVTWNFTRYAGIQPAIVMHVGTNETNVADIGEAIWNSTVNGMFEVMHPSFEPTSISILPLDGVSPTFIAVKPDDVDTTLCESGGEILPAVAQLVTYSTGQRGPQGRGRSFIGPASEPTIADGVFNQTPTDDCATALGTFLANLGTQPEPLFLGVASYVHAEMYPITGLNVQRVAATMRRRQNQLR